MQQGHGQGLGICPAWGRSPCCVERVPVGQERCSSPVNPREAEPMTQDCIPSIILGRALECVWTVGSWRGGSVPPGRAGTQPRQVLPAPELARLAGRQVPVLVSAPAPGGRWGWVWEGGALPWGGRQRGAPAPQWLARCCAVPSALLAWLPGPPGTWQVPPSTRNPCWSLGPAGRGGAWGLKVPAAWHC